MRLLSTALFFLVMASSFGQVRLSECSPLEDWIELRNDGAAIVNLDGYGLSDGGGETWIFPEFELASGERVLVEASGLNRNYLPNQWMCPIVESVVWQYVVPPTNLPDDWKLPGYNAAGWNSGPGGIGYADGDDATLLTDEDLVFMRRSFQINDPADWGYMCLAIDYDDGYIAYLNGHEISRSDNMNGVSGLVGSWATYQHEAVMYTGGMPDALLWGADEFEPWLLPGENVLAVQVHNVNQNSSDLTIRPFLGLTRKDGELGTWPSAPSWWPEFEGVLHTDFSLSLGETVELLDANGQSIDALPIGQDLPFGHTVGREETATANWCIFDEATPGVANANQCFTGIAPEPLVSALSGWYENSVQVQLLPAAENWTIRFTTNGDEPNAFSPEFPEEGLALNATSALSLKAWGASNVLPSAVRDETYIIDEFTPDIPTFSLITDDYHLFDYNTGIYVFGPNAAPDYPYFGANFWQPWSRPARLLFFDESGLVQARERLDLEIHGGWSRAEPQRSFRLDFKNEFTGDFEYPLFEGLPSITSFNNLNLRNGGQHSWASKFQDGLIGRLAARTHNLASAYRPVHVYLNGAYWGLYGAREKTDERFIADHFGTDKDEVDLIGPFAVLSGSDADFYSAANLLQSTPTSNSGFYPLFASNFDIENYIDYFVFETYIQNTDWMGIAWGLNNTKTFRTEPDAPWRYLLYDTDAGFGFFGANASENFINFARNPGYPNVHSDLFDRVLDNTQFRLQFINRYADLVNTLFQTQAFNADVDAFIDALDAGMAPHIERWNSPATNLVWLNAINNLTSHNSTRIGTSRNHLMNSFGLPDSHECTLDAFPPLAGHVRVNTIEPGPLPWNGIYFEECPIELEAIAATGYLFDKWDVNAHIESGDVAEFEKLNEVALHSNDLYRARFTPCPSEGVSATVVNVLGALTVETDGVPYVDSVLWYVDGEALGFAEAWWPQTFGSYEATVFFDGCSVNTEPVEAGTVAILERTPLRIHIAPNPADESVRIEVEDARSIEVFASNGQCVHAEVLPEFASANAVVIETKNWPEGIYIVRSGPIREKLIIQH